MVIGCCSWEEADVNRKMEVSTVEKQSLVKAEHSVIGLLACMSARLFDSK